MKSETIDVRERNAWINTQCKFRCNIHMQFINNWNHDKFPTLGIPNNVYGYVPEVVQSSSLITAWRIQAESMWGLTLQLARSPSPPAQTMLVVTRLPHQSFLEQLSWLTTGRRACWRASARGPPAGYKDGTPFQIHRRTLNGEHCWGLLTVRLPSNVRCPWYGGLLFNIGQLLFNLFLNR